MVRIGRIEGIDEDSLALLEAAGFQHASSLARISPIALHRELSRANELLRIAPAVPDVSRLQDLIAAARKISGINDALDANSEANEASAIPNVIQLLEAAPVAVPLSARMMVENKLGVADVPEALALDEIACYLGADRMLDFMLRTGPYGDGFGANPNGISLTHMKQHPHGIDFGPLEPRIPEALRTPSGKVELAPEPLLADLPRLAKSMNEFNDEQLVLVGRRHLRSNNSWMHNIEVLVKGKERCTLQMHPNDAQRVGVKEGGVARIASRVGAIDAVVELTSDIRERVVSLPHGWGHDMSGTRMNVAAKRAGVNSNVLTDENEMDPLSGNSVMNGIPVTITPVG